MSELSVKVFSEAFGGGILIKIPPEEGSSAFLHILMDFGTIENDANQALVLDALSLEDGQAIDLYIATHFHMSCFGGLSDIIKTKIQCYWLPFLSKPYFSAKRPKVQDFLFKRDEVVKHLKVLHKAKALVDANRAEYYYLTRLLYDNDIENILLHLQGLLQNGTAKLTYDMKSHIIKGFENIIHPLKIDLGLQDNTYSLKLPFDTSVDILDTGIDYAPFQGVDIYNFCRLITGQQDKILYNLKVLDRRYNNLSISFYLCWKGFNLLFPGHAQDLRWQQIAGSSFKENKTDFLLTSRQAGYRGLPPQEFLQKLFRYSDPDNENKQPVVAVQANNFGTLDTTLVNVRVVPIDNTANSEFYYKEFIFDSETKTINVKCKRRPFNSGG